MPAPERTPGPSTPPPGELSDAALAAQREHSLMALVELGRALDLRLGEAELTQLALFNLVGHFGAPHAALWLLPEGGGPLRTTAVVGLTREAAEAMAVELDALPGDWPEGEVVRLFSAPWLGRFGDLARRSGLSALVRLEGQHDWLGYVGLAAPRSRPFFGPIDRELLGASLGILAAAIENQRLVRDLHVGQQRLAAANERMKELDRVRTEMLQNLNHEFRTPIAVILGAASCLRDAPSSDVTRRRFLDMIEKHAAQARDMITTLLDHAELMSVGAAVACEPTDVVACVRDTVARRAGALAEAGREVDVTAEGVLVAEADALRLSRVVDELISNALKFSPAGTHVTVAVSRSVTLAGNSVCVEVTDRGRGMTSEELAVAFEPFRQGDGSSTRTAGGLGIGLAAARRTVELMGGSLVLASEFGRGTTARLALRAVTPA